ncbi:peptidase inhibitor family I36 protein [Allonocardiopsis opalescens]|uniref:Peptidase inhibitor family I36 n=1 Tax=Allonocardiopsis opalescens TaxID=1144618 RepID=A0A2T0Q1J4_9ACTN|nr:peptidase inhibitor family I36 protein [Allonocardiopsis opalescens]PRX97664.1 peptidase inhibitor family I36 [Allonocardiopsis opalescens]
MFTSPALPARLARVTLAAAAAAAALLPLSAAQAAASPLPPGVIRLNDGEPCPFASLCLYRDYNFSGPAYAVGAGYNVNLYELPMPGGVHGPSAANEVSSWVNRTGYLAVLIDVDDDVSRPLPANRTLQEPPPNNDTVDLVRWP